MPRAAPAPSHHWRAVAAAQCQVLSLEQALEGGMTPSAWRHGFAARGWRRLLPGIALLVDVEPDEQQRAWAAVLHGGPGTAVSGRLALRLQGLERPAPALDLAVPHERKVRRPPTAGLGVALVPHRVVRLQDLVHPLREPRQVRPAPATLHAAAWAASDAAAETSLALAVQQRLVTPGLLQEALALHPRLPRRALLRQVLDDLEHGVQARGELQFVRFLRAHGLPVPDDLQRVVRAGTRRYVLDGWYARARVAVELDGAHHRDVDTWEADLLRSNDLGLRHRDAVLLRFTTALLRHRPERVLQQLRAALG